MSQVTIKGHSVREDWLNRRREEVLDPDIPLIDAHHHLFQQGAHRYLFDELLADISDGHDVRATVYIEAGAMSRADGDPMLRPLGEFEFANGIAAMSASGAYGAARLCAAIIAHADLRCGAAIGRLLDRYQAASPERFRGLRQCGAFDPDPRITTLPAPPPPGLFRDPAFREGFAEIAKRGLTFDSWLYHPQLSDLADLARAFPDVQFIMDHMGGRLGIGDYAHDPSAVTRQWERSVREVAACPNVAVKVGGFAMRMMGFGFHERPEPPGSDDLAAAWSPFFEVILDAFGWERIVFESNFPVDKTSCSYRTLWNAFKRLTADRPAHERAAMLGGNALRLYGLDRALLAPRNSTEGLKT